MSRSTRSTKYSIEVRDLTKVFNTRKYLSRNETLKSFLIRALRGQLTIASTDASNTALRGINFNVHHGQTLGIIGSNGSGKSTLLKLLAGLMAPTSGEILVGGRVSALIELGSGFHPEISGRENVFINGVMLGLSRSEVAEKFETIVRFAELEQFIDQPVKNYSSGMFMRLGFSVAVHVTPEILLIDEVLAVGDEGFVHKCFERIDEFKRQGKTIVIVSHDLGTMERLCDEVIWIEKGQLREHGFPRRVIDAYLTHVHEQEQLRLASSNAETELQAMQGHREAEVSPQGAGISELTGTYQAEQPPPGEAADGSEPDPFPQERWGTKEIRFTQIRLLDATDKESAVFHTGDTLTVEMSYEASKDLFSVDFGVGVFRADGANCFGVNTTLDRYRVTTRKGNGTVRFVIPRLGLLEGSYLLDVAVHTPDGHPYDYVRRIRRFLVHSRRGGAGVFMPEHSWEFSGTVAAEAVPEKTEAAQR